MRVAIISDIHGNALALDVAIADLKRDQVDHIVCLGDAIQGGPQPVKVIAQLRQLACPVVMGNADAWLLTGQHTGAEPIPEARALKMDAVREWSLEQLSDDDRAFIKSFQPTVEIPLENGRHLLCFHGSPASFDDIILPTTTDADFQMFVAPFIPGILTGGHTHMQQIRRIGAGDSFYFNPGSIGFAYSHYQPQDSFHADAWAEYAILTDESGRLALEFRRVPYDAESLIKIYRASDRPHTDDSIAQYTP